MCAAACNVPHISASELSNLERIAEGGFGEIFKARHSEFGDVVYKRMLIGFIKEKDRSACDMQKEAFVHSQLKHPNITRILGIVFEERNYGVVLEYMKHGDLKEFLENHDVPWQFGLKIARDVAVGMSYLHGMSVIHGDLKAQNVLIGDDFVAKVADFGLAKWREFSRSKTGKRPRAGTTTHISPELWLDANHHIDEPDDVYAFGILLWEIASRRQPFNCSDPYVIRTNVMDGNRPDLKEIPKHYPEEYSRVMTLSWSSKPEDRPQFLTLKQSLERLSAEHRLSPEMIKPLHVQDVLHALPNQVAAAAAATNIETVVRPYSDETSMLDVGREAGVIDRSSFNEGVNNRPLAQAESANGKPDNDVTKINRATDEGPSQTVTNMSSLTQLKRLASDDSPLPPTAAVPPMMTGVDRSVSQDGPVSHVGRSAGRDGHRQLSPQNSESLSLGLQSTDMTSAVASSEGAASWSTKSTASTSFTSALTSLIADNNSTLTENFDSLNLVDSIEQLTWSQRADDPPAVQTQQFSSLDHARPSSVVRTNSNQFHSVTSLSPQTVQPIPHVGQTQQSGSQEALGTNRQSASSSSSSSRSRASSSDSSNGSQAQSVAPPSLPSSSSAAQSKMNPASSASKVPEIILKSGPNEVRITNLDGLRAQIQVGNKNVMNVGSWPNDIDQVRPSSNGDARSSASKPKKKIVVEDKEVSERERDLVSQEIGKDWRNLGRKLGLSNAVLDDVEHNHRFERLNEIAYQMLRNWHETFGCDATVLKLAKALVDIRRPDVAKKLQKQ